MVDYNDELVYDLRQKYAEIVGFHLEKVAEAKINRLYPEYFRALEDLFTVIKHKFRAKKKTPEDEEEYEPTYVKKEEENKDKKTDLDLYYELRQFAIDKANEYENAFLGRTDDPEEIAQIEKSLREVEMFLWYIMDKAKMFGSYSSNRNL